MDIDVGDMPYQVDVVEVEPLSGHRIRVRFDDGNEGVYDMTPMLGFGVFEALSDDDVFYRAHVAYGTVVWPGGLDIAPERLWTDCDPIGEDWRPRLLPERYFD